MIYYQDQYTETQLQHWVDRALTAQQQIRKLEQRELHAVYASLDIEDPQDELDALAWANTFMDYINRWSYRMPNSTILLWADPQSLDSENNCKEFNFVVYNRPASEFGNFDDPKPCAENFSYNGGFINHGTSALPNWASHT